MFRAKLRTLVCKPPVNCSVTHKPLDNKNNGTCYDCYQFVIKRLIEIAETRINTGFFKQLDLFKLAKSGLILIISVQLSIPFCIDNSYFFHTLFFVSHIFSTNPVPLHFFIIVCSSGGLQVSFTTHRIIFCWFACPPMEIIIYIQYFCKKKFCGTNR